jgi:hypothetical protein
MSILQQAANYGGSFDKIRGKIIRKLKF